MQTSTIQLHDIKPLMVIDDYSLHYVVALTLGALVFIGGIIYLLLHFFKTRKKYNQRKDYAQKIMQLDIKQSKQTAYDLTLYGALFAEDSPRHKEMYKNLVKRLAPYKYKKEVEPLDDEVVGYIELYKGMLDV